MRLLSVSIEDYIKTIHALEAQEEKATTKRIAERLGVKMASVTGMIKHLAAEGYLRHTPYYGVKLTETGRRVAVDLIRRHRLIELFLCKTLGLTWDEVDADAEVLEHVVSDRLIGKIYEYLGRPAFDPHGSPIPMKNGAIPPPQGVPLDEMGVGDSGTVIEVSDRDPAFLRYLTKLKLKIGSEIRLRERAPFGGPVTLQLGGRKVSLGRDACARVRVRVTSAGRAKRRRR
ncbi:MAG: metal-dependent transcriptional regulator [Phycisphaerae bacterium]